MFQLRNVFGAVRHHVGHQPHRGHRRKDVGAARDVLFEHVVLHGAAELLERNAAPARDRQHEREQDRGRRVDRHRDGDAVERDLGEERLDVGDRIDRDADFADFAARLRRIGVVAELRRQVEGDRESGDAVVEQVAVARVGFRGAREARILAHRPMPPAIHVAADAARERKAYPAAYARPRDHRSRVAAEFR